MMAIDILTSPSTLFFLIFATGYLLGKIKIMNVSLDISAILLISIAFGYVLSKFYPQIVDEPFINTMSAYSKLGTLLFISAIGIISGFEISGATGKKWITYFIIGALMVLGGIFIVKVISVIDDKLNISILAGILCGALTSTPALAAVCELQSINQNSAVLGYGAAYLFGVFGVVILVQILAKKYNSEDKIEDIKSSKKDILLDNLLVIAVTSIIGEFLGKLYIPFLKISIGSSGGVLIFGIIIGYLIKKHLKNTTLSITSLNTYRNIGLIMFFIGTGISAGIKLNTLFEIKYFIYGALITISSVLCGVIICKAILKTEPKTYMSIIAGGMTSSPALGALLKKNNCVNYTAYSATYLGALICIIFASKVFFNN